MNFKKLLTTTLFGLTLPFYMLAQSLSPGDIAIIGMDGQPSTGDAFNFVSLVDIPANTVIYFTDEEGNGGYTMNAASPDGILRYVVPAGGLAAGDVVDYVRGTVNPDFTLVEGDFRLDNTSDNLIAYQSNDTNTVTTYLHAVSSTSGSYGSLPVGTDIVVFGATNGEYSGTRTGTAPALYDSINDVSNWTVQSGGFFGTMNTTAFTVTCTPPTQASALSIDIIDDTQIGISWTRGTGDSILVVARNFDSTSTDPVNDTYYNANANFGTGAQLAPGNYAVYRGTGNLVTITGLQPAQHYVFYVYEFDSDGSGNICYNTTEVSADTTTDCSVADLPVGVTADPGDAQVTITWAYGNCGDSAMVVASTSPISTNPTGNQTDYNADSVYTNGQQLSGAEYVVYSGNGNSVTVTNLTNTTQYYFAVFASEYNAPNTDWSAKEEASATPQANPSAVTDLVINEIMYNSGTGNDEWIEIYNGTTNPVTLTDYRLDYGTESMNLDGTIPVDGYYTIALGSDGDNTFNNDKPFTPDTNALGVNNAMVASTDSMNQLDDNFGSLLELVYVPSSTSISGVPYQGMSPWPEAANGGGPSLELIDPDLDETQAANWLALTNGGTPGAENTAAYVWDGTEWHPNDPSGNTSLTAPIYVNGAGAVLSNNTGTFASVYIAPEGDLDIGIYTLSADTVFVESNENGQGQVQGTVSGTTEFQSYLTSPSARWFNVAFPINGSLNDVELTNGGFIQTLAEVDSAFVNIYWYDTDMLNPVTGEGTWRPVASRNALLDTAGYSIYLGGPYFGTLPMKVVSYGDLNEGTESVDLSAANVGWNFVPNPYATSVNWNLLWDDNTHLNQTYYIFDADQGDSAYVGYNYSGGTIPGDVNATDQYIAPGQAFFVQSTTNDPLVFNSSHQTMTATTELYKMQPNPGIYLMVHTTDSMSDYTYVGFKAGVADTKHPRYDGVKMMNTAYTVPSLYTSLVGEDYMFKFVNDQFNKRSVPVHLEMAKNGQLTISSEFRNIDPSWTVELEDKLQGKTIDLRMNDYTFMHNGANDADRFVLHINQGTVSLVEEDAVDIYAFYKNDHLNVNLGNYSSNGNLEIQLFDVTGKLVKTAEANSEDFVRINLSGNSQGVYILKVADDGNPVHTQKVIRH